ncbi:hypothetical protein Tco_1445046 [Tanacetum coccineum]
MKVGSSSSIQARAIMAILSIPREDVQQVLEEAHAPGHIGGAKIYDHLMTLGARSFARSKQDEVALLRRQGSFRTLLTSSCSTRPYLFSKGAHTRCLLNEFTKSHEQVEESSNRPWRTEPTYVAKYGDDLWLGVKGQPRSDIAGFPRNRVHHQEWPKMVRSIPNNASHSGILRQNGSPFRGIKRPRLFYVESPKTSYLIADN